MTADLQQAVAKANAGAWMVATGEDLRWPGTEGGPVTVADRVVRRYHDRVVAAATTDPVIGGAFFDVIGLLAPPTSLLRPAIAPRVLGRCHAVPPPAPPAPPAGTSDRPGGLTPARDRAARWPRRATRRPDPAPDRAVRSPRAPRS